MASDEGSEVMGVGGLSVENERSGIHSGGGGANRSKRLHVYVQVRHGCAL